MCFFPAQHTYILKTTMIRQGGAFGLSHSKSLFISLVKSQTEPISLFDLAGTASLCFPIFECLISCVVETRVSK